MQVWQLLLWLPITTATIVWQRQFSLKSEVMIRFSFSSSTKDAWPSPLVRFTIFELYSYDILIEPDSPTSYPENAALSLSLSSTQNKHPWPINFQSCTLASPIPLFFFTFLLFLLLVLHFCGPQLIISGKINKSNSPSLNKTFNEF